MSPESQQYERIVERYEGASEADKKVARDELNDRLPGFGDDFYAGRSIVMIAWADLAEDDRDKVAAFIEEELDSEEGE